LSLLGLKGLKYFEKAEKTFLLSNKLLEHLFENSKITNHETFMLYNRLGVSPDKGSAKGL